MSVSSKNFLYHCDLLLDQLMFLDIKNFYHQRMIDLIYNILKYNIQFAPTIEERKYLVSKFENIIVNKGLFRDDFKIHVRSNEFDPAVWNTDIRDAVMKKISVAVNFLSGMYQRVSAQSYMSLE